MTDNEAPTRVPEKDVHPLGAPEPGGPRLFYVRIRETSSRHLRPLRMPVRRLLMPPSHT